MAIYPVIKGQQLDQRNAIPPRASLSEPRALPNEASGDLIDFGDDGSAPQQPLGNQPSLDPHRSTAPVRETPSTNSRRAQEGSLIDFHEDMKKNLPGGIKRTESADSDDEFVDARE